MFAHLRRMAFFDEAAIPERIYYIGGYSALQSGGLDALVTLIRGAIQKQKATLLVVDGLISAQESAPTEREFKQFIHEIQTLTDLTGCTVLLLTNVERTSGFFPEHTMVDGVLHLTDELSELRPLRHIRVLKLRGSAPSAACIPSASPTRASRCGPGSRRCFPRVTFRRRARRSAEAGVRRRRTRRDATRRSARRVDHHAAGFLRQRQNSAGDAVSVRGPQARRTGRVSSDSIEHPEAVLAKCQRVGIGGLAEGVERGNVEIVWHRPVEGVIDELGESLINTVRKTGARRIFIDGMDGFERAADFPERMCGCLQCALPRSWNVSV